MEEDDASHNLPITLVKHCGYVSYCSYKYKHVLYGHCNILWIICGHLCAILSLPYIISTMYASLDFNIGNCGVDGQW